MPISTGEKLFRSVQRDDNDGVVAAIGAGADPNIRLIELLGPEDIDNPKELTSAWIVNRREPDAGSRPLHWACLVESLSIVCTLICHGADVNLTDAAGMTPLHQAIQVGNTAIVDVLIRNGAGVNAVDNVQGMTPLLWAYFSCPDAIDTLLQSCADPNRLGDRSGYNILHYAAIRGEYQLFAQLLDAGAASTFLSVSGESAIDLAERYGHSEQFLALLENQSRPADFE